MMHRFPGHNNLLFFNWSSFKVTEFYIGICDVQFRKVVKYNSFQHSSTIHKMQDKLKNNNKHNGRWTKEEHLNFLQGLRVYGRNWKKIEQLVQTRSGSQIRSHAQKFFVKNKSSEPIDFQEDFPLSGDLQEYPQEITRNSKSICETSLRRDDHSYYFDKIVSYSSGKSDLNFWQALVDCKGATANSIQQSRKNSFQSFESEQNSATELISTNKIKV